MSTLRERKRQEGQQRLNEQRGTADSVAPLAVQAPAASPSPAQAGMSMIERTMYSAKQVAGMLGICTRGVWRLVASGMLRQPVRIGRASRFPASEIEAYFTQIKQERAT